MIHLKIGWEIYMKNMKNNKMKTLFALALGVSLTGLVACDKNTESTNTTDSITDKGTESIVSIIDKETTDLGTTDLVNDEMEWRYYDGDEDPNAGTWYEEWNKRNGWAYPEGWLDWGTVPMEFTEAEWPTYKGTLFSTATDTEGQMLEKNADDKAKSTYFFRHTFTLTQEQAENIYELEITARYNDAMTMYINGSPVGGFHNIPTANYSENLEYGAQEKVADGEFLEETFIVDDVSSIMNGFVPGEYTGNENENGDIRYELSEATTDDDGNTFIDITIAVELHAYDPNDNEASFELLNFVVNPDETELAADSEEVKNIAMNPGENERLLNFTWNALSSEAGEIQLAEGSNPEEFSEENARIFEADTTELSYTKFTSIDYFVNKGTIEIEPDKEYLYRVGNAEAYSPVYSLNTQDIEEGHEAIFLADPQIGTGTIPTDVFGWERTLKQAFKTVPEASFILNAGDFVDTANKESEYDAYFTPEILASYPTVTTVGNHDVAVNYRNHFNEPNQSTLGEDEAGSDYYFTYGNVLYMVLNTNNLNNEEHVQFLEETVAKTADQAFDWKVVLFHQSIYAAGKQALNEDAPARQEALVPIGY
jgi:hypothetical protein